MFTIDDITETDRVNALILDEANNTDWSPDVTTGESNIITGLAQTKIT